MTKAVHEKKLSFKLQTVSAYLAMARRQFLTTMNDSSLEMFAEPFRRLKLQEPLSNVDTAPGIVNIATSK